MRALIICILSMLLFKEMRGQSHLKLSFTTNDSSFLPAVKEYAEIWNEEGNKIIKSMEKLSGMKFLDTSVVVIIYEAPSNSGDLLTDPMKLRASYPYEVKKATIIHELGHRLNFFVRNYPKDFNDHNLLFLYLYDVWVDLYGEKFANDMVQIEYLRSNPRNDYRAMWEVALNMSKDKRKKKLKEFILQHG